MNIRLKTKIIKSPKNQRMISKEVGIHASKLSDIVGEWIEPDIELQKKIAKSLNCKIDEIF